MTARGRSFGRDGGGRLHAALQLRLAAVPRLFRVSLWFLCAVLLLFEIPGVSNAKAVRFWFCFYVQIPIACHVRAISPAPSFNTSRTRTHVLHFLDFSRAFVIHVDANEAGAGAYHTWPSTKVSTSRL